MAFGPAISFQLIEITKLNGFVSENGQFAAASIIFSDNFDADAGSVLNASLINWDVTAGSIDVIASGDFAINCVGNIGNCVDLDGSNLAAGTIETKSTFNLPAGDYRLTFDLSGNQRSGQSDSVTVSLGTVFNELFQKAPADLFENIVRDFSVAAATSANLVFAHAGGDNIGLILDNVTLESLDNGGGQPGVLEPGTLAMFGFGLAGLGFLRRRRAMRGA